MLSRLTGQPRDPPGIQPELIDIQGIGSGDIIPLDGTTFLLFKERKKNHIPHNYADFLNYANKLTFMKNIGGGYKFYHEFFQDHFKKMDG